MDFLKQQIASQKRALEQAESTDGPAAKKWVRASELNKSSSSATAAAATKKEALLEAAKEIAVKEDEQGKTLSLAATNLLGGGGGGKSASATPEPGAGGAGGAKDKDKPEAFNITSDEAVRRLRAKGQPIRLFNESDKDRRLRLRALELIEERTEGQLNEFARALESADRALVADAIKQKGKEKEGTPATDGEDKDKEVRPKDKEVIVDVELVKTNPHKIYPQIYHALKRVLKEWEQSLADRPESVRRSTQGKMASATQATSAEYLKPLFKSLKARNLAPDVLQAIAEITYNMQVREYLRANDAYLRLSIGNAPWPIGVTMVGIHERSGREKIFSNNVAHVLNDETSRKYIQSLKRLLTFHQSVYPPDDVSQKMG